MSLTDTEDERKASGARDPQKQLEIGERFSPYAMFTAVSLPGWILSDRQLSSDAKLLWAYLVREADLVEQTVDPRDGPPVDRSDAARSRAVGLPSRVYYKAMIELEEADCLYEGAPVIAPWANLRGSQS